MNATQDLARPWLIYPPAPGWREEYELRIVSICAHEPVRLGQLVGVLTTEDFKIPKYRFYFEAMLALQEKREPISYASCWKELDSKGQFEAAGGVLGWTELGEAFISSAHFRHYTNTLREENRRLRVAELSTRFGAGERVDDEMLAALQREFTPGTDGHVSLGMVAKNMAERYEAGMPLDESALPTPWPDLTYSIIGLSPGTLNLIAARPGRGKSVFLLDLASYLANKNFPVLFYSLEMRKEAIASRALAALSSVDHQDIRRGRINTQDGWKVSKAGELIASWPLVIDDRSGLTIDGLHALAREEKAKGGVAAIFVDYAQLVSDPKAERRFEEMASVSRGLKALANDLGVPVVAAVQLSRAAENERPRLAHIRECGQFEQDADVVMAIWMDEKDEQSEEPPIEVSILKNRQGPGRRVSLLFQKRFCRMVQVERKEFTL